MSEYIERLQHKPRFISMVTEERSHAEQPPKVSFDDQKRRLKEFLDAKRQTVPDSPEYFRLVEQYNETLNDMLDSGLSVPLEDELLLDDDLLSDRYMDFEAQWNKKHHPFTAQRLIKERSSFICLVEVSKVESHTVQATVVRQYKGELPDEIRIGFYIPWGMSSWYKDGERAVVFLDDDYISLGLSGRMPVIERGGVEYAVSYEEDPDFWPGGVSVKQETLDGQRVSLIELRSLEAIIKSNDGERVDSSGMFDNEEKKGESPTGANVKERLNDLQPRAKGDEHSTKIRSGNSEAYWERKKGRRFLRRFTKYSLNRAKEHFRRAIELDETLAEAHSGLAASYVAAGIYNIASPKESFGEAIDHANRAIELDNQMVEAYTSLAYAYMCYKWDWTEAEKNFKRALEIDPDYPLALQGRAHWLGAMGRFQEALTEIDRAIEKAPNKQMPKVVRGFILYYAGSYKESWEQFLELTERDKSFDAAYYGLALASEPLALAYMEEGNEEQAKAMFDAAKEAARKAVEFSKYNPVKWALQAHVYALSGEAGKAHQELQQLNILREQEYVSAFQLAAIYAAMVTTCDALEKPEQAVKYYKQALDYLEVAYEENDQWLALLNVEPRFTILHGDEQFKGLIHKLHFLSDTMTSDATDDKSSSYQTYSEPTPQE